jgi:hypothetical protein
MLAWRRRSSAGSSIAEATIGGQHTPERELAVVAWSCSTCYIRAVGRVHRAVYDRLLVVIVGVGVFLGFPLAASSASISVPSWNGAWAETTAGDPQGHIYLSEASGSATVTGHYTLCNGSINATNHGGVLTGTWTQSWPCAGARTGSGQIDFRLNANGRQFKGTWGYDASATDSSPAADTWTGTLQDLEVPGTPQVPVGRWSGSWSEKVSGSPLATLYLLQRAGSSTVVGSYAFCNGQIKAVDHDGALNGTWTQTPGCGNAAKGFGRIAFRLNAKGNGLTGTWGYGSSATNSRPNSNNTWVGTRLTH